LLLKSVERKEDGEGGRGSVGPKRAEEALEGEVEDGPDGILYPERGEGDEGVCGGGEGGI